MNKKLRQHGFTLIELLVAVALIATVLAMVYGSYIATTRSAQACKSRIALSEQGRKTLEQIARHVRCSYAGSVCDNTEDVKAGSDQTQTEPGDRVNYFKGDTDAPDGEVLHLVTTCGLSGEKRATDGLFEVVYRFDKRTSELALSLVRFVAASREAERRDWRVIADEIESIDLAFFDGEQWLGRWDFEDKKELPRAVRIEISGENESFQRYDYSTVAYVSCRDYRAETLVSVDRK
ncbi:MAG: prepilin-type N-terminal cleavage/methylation domain-containing protein [Phycisphaerae bacterium]|nr:prepilin-type N-terminal cleavage/methylation domain-containing protein [Phycisphaerae bacterium]